MSQKPSNSHSLQAQSIPDVKAALHATASRVGRSVRFETRKLRPGPMLNALVMYLASLDDADQVAVVERGMRAFEALTAREAPVVGDVQSRDDDENDRIAAAIRDAVGRQSGSIPVMESRHGVGAVKGGHGRKAGDRVGSRRRQRED